MIIEAQNLKKLYRTPLVETTALDSVNFAVDSGQFVSIMGPSGCGKSTLLHILGLIDTPNEGSYRFLGEDVSRYPERKRAAIRKRNIGFVFQSFNLIDDLTVEENVEVALLYRKDKSGKKKRIVEALERVGVAPRARHRPQQLSGGQQQRVAVARALVSSPKLILADEPTGNLDTAMADQVVALLHELNRTEGQTIVLVTHDPAIGGSAGRVVRMRDGHLIGDERRPLAPLGS